jgi:thiamine pyrophosphate-dependent acetolactate synthase large subunit-like protein
LQFGGNVVRIDIDAEQINRRTTPTVGIVGDAAHTMAKLTRGISTRGIVARNATTGAQRAQQWRDHARNKTSNTFVPWLQVIEQWLPENSIVALDSTQLGYSAHWWLPAIRSRSWLAPYGFGTLGCALPMAIGAAVAAPDRPVLVIAGDGGWLFTVAEMAAAHDLKSNITMVLWDNSGYEQIRTSFDDVQAPRMGVDVTSHDPSAIARGFGWNAVDVTTPEQLATSLDAALKSSGPHFIRIAIS